MWHVFSYLLPRRHTSLLRSFVICMVAGVISIPIALAGEAIPSAIAGPTGEWLRLVLLVIAFVLRFVPAVSAVIALFTRFGFDTSNIALHAMLMWDYLRGLWPNRARGKE